MRVFQSVKPLTSAQVIISRVCEFKPCVRLCAWSLLPILCLPLTLPLPYSCSVSLSLFLSKITIKIKKKIGKVISNEMTIHNQSNVRKSKMWVQIPQDYRLCECTQHS